MTQVRAWRKWGAGAAGVVAAVVLYVIAEGYPTVFPPIIALLAAAITVHRASLGPQLFSRAVWWSNLAIGVLLSLSGNERERHSGLWIAAACAAALFIAGRKAIAEASERAGYAPAALRSSLLLMMVLGLADAQTLALFTFVTMDKGHGPWWVAAIGAVAFVVGFVGLLRLAVWGAIVNACTALGLLVLTATNLFSVDESVDWMIIGVCAIQLVVVAPVFLALARKKTILPSFGPRVRALGTSCIVAGLVFVSVLGAAGVIRVR
jgi:hypothetical protein